MGGFISIVTSKLGKLASNQKFRETFSKLTGGFVAPQKTGFVQSASTWIAQNPVKAQGALAVSLSAISNVLPSIFSDEEIIEVAPVIADVDFEKGIYTPDQTATMNALMGDKKAGYFGTSEIELKKSAVMMANSIKKTNEIARLFGIHPADVEKAMFLISTYEPGDGEIYRNLGK